MIYGIIGLLAFDLAIGHGGKITNQQGALRTVEHHPFGNVLLAALAVGLGGYALWRLFRAALGHGREASDQGIERLGGSEAASCTRDLRPRCRDPRRERKLVQQEHEADHRRRLRLAGRPLAHRRRRTRDARRRRLPVQPRVKKKFLKDARPRRFRTQSSRPIRCSAQSVTSPARSSWPRRGLPRQGSLRLQSEPGDRARRALAKLYNGADGAWLLGAVAAGLIAFAVLSLVEARFRRI